MAFLETQDISRAFGKLWAVNRVSLDLRQGDIHAIIGPNGAGKSTYFNLITGYHRATTGKVLYKGKDITRLPAHERCNQGSPGLFRSPASIRSSPFMRAS